jgi:hypothetical protein
VTNIRPVCRTQTQIASVRLHTAAHTLQELGADEWVLLALGHLYNKDRCVPLCADGLALALCAPTCPRRLHDVSRFTPGLPEDRSEIHLSQWSSCGILRLHCGITKRAAYVALPDAATHGCREFARFTLKQAPEVVHVCLPQAHLACPDLLGCL